MKAGKRSGRSGGEVFGRLVAVRRAGLGLSQEDLAARIDTSQANVARIEEGQPPSTETLKQLEAALDTEPATGALRRSLARARASGDGAWTSPRAGVSLAVAIVAALWLSMIVVDDGGARIGLATAAVGALWLWVIVAERGAASRIAPASNVQRQKDAPRRPIAPAIGSGGGARTPWSSLDRRWLWGGLVIAVLVPVLVILGGRFSGTDSGDSSQQSPQALSAAPPVAPVAAGGVQGKSRKTKKPEKKKPEKQSATPPAAVNEPSFARAPATKKRSPATVQPASKPVASSPAPSSTSGGGGSIDPPQPSQPPQPPQAEHGIGGGEASHGIVPGGG